MECTIVLRSKYLAWQLAEDGKSATNLMLVAASVGDYGNVLTSKVESIAVSAYTQKPDWLARTASTIPLKLHLPRKAKYVRVVLIQGGEGGRLGSVELSRETLKAAPQAPTPEPKLIPRSVD